MISSIKILICVALLMAFAVIGVFSYPTQNLDQQKNSEDALEDHHQQQYINNDDDDEPADISTELIEGFLINHPKLFARLVEQFNLDDFESGNQVAEDTNGRTKRRVSVFNNVYQKCRIQKRREKNLCLYLANLYQNLKGFHGL